MIVFGLIIAIFGFIFFKIIDKDVIENWMIIAWFSFSVVFAVYIIATISIHYVDIKMKIM